MFLITCPTHDVTTYYISYFSKEIISNAKSKGKKVIELNGKKANKKNVESILKKRSVRLIMFNGHGNETTVTGHQNNYIIKSPVNVKLLDSKIVYCRSCKCAKKLGIDSIIEGAVAFIGFDDDFIFVYDQSKITDPKHDTTAKLFLDPSNMFLLSMLKGHTVLESYEKSQKEYNRNIEKLLTSEASDEDRESLRYLIWDKNHHQWEGSSQATYL